MLVGEAAILPRPAVTRAGRDPSSKGLRLRLPHVKTRVGAMRSWTDDPRPRAALPSPASSPFLLTPLHRHDSTSPHMEKRAGIRKTAEPRI